MAGFRWDDLRVFLALHRAGAVIPAATALSCSPSTISRRIAAFEHDLGLLLFDRTPDGLRPTEHARALLPLAEQAEATANRVEHMVMGMDERVRGVVRLASVEGFGTLWLAPQLHQLHQRHPELELEVLTGNAVVDLARREADLAVRLVRPRDADLVCKRVAASGVGAWAHEGYLARHGDAGWEELDWITWERSLAHLPESQWIETHVRRKPRLRVNSGAMGLAAVEAGLGVSWMTDAIARSRPSLVPVPDVPGPNRQVEVWMVAQKDVRRVPRVAAVWQWLTERFERGALEGAPPVPP